VAGGATAAAIEWQHAATQRKADAKHFGWQLMTSPRLESTPDGPLA